AFYINLGHAERDRRFPPVKQDDFAAIVQPFLRNPLRQLIAHNAVYELRGLFRLGIDDIRCRVSDSLIHIHRTDENLRDSLGTWHYHLPTINYGLKNLMAALEGVRPPRLAEVTGNRNPMFASIEPIARYCVVDCQNSWTIYCRAAQHFAEDPSLKHLVETIDDPNNLVLARMMWEGIGIDVTEARNQWDIYDRAIGCCRTELWRLLSTRQRLDTPTAARQILKSLNFAEEFGYEPFDDANSANRETLLRAFSATTDPQKQQVLALFLSMWGMKQRISAFVEPYLNRARDGRLFAARFASTLVTTRFSSSPNLQNLPGRADATGDDGWREVLPASCRAQETTRNIFVARPGHLLVSMDLSAAEPRYLSLLFERALREQDSRLVREKTLLQLQRESRYPVLMQAMYDLRGDGRHTPEKIVWPTYQHDPLWEVFHKGQDPYNALLKAIDRSGFEEAKRQNRLKAWFKENRWRGKKAFLALAYGSGPASLAPQLKWSVEQTQRALRDLETEYATLGPLRELTLREVVHTGSVRTLWDRPRRISGYYQLARPNPLTIEFYYMRPTRRTYQARIIPLGTTRQQVQAFVEECGVERPDGSFRVVLAGNPDGTVRHIDRRDRFASADHFNKPPFRNIPFSCIRSIREENGLMRTLPRQEQSLRRAFNSLCQSTGADHLRWIMNNVDAEVCRKPKFRDCRLILTMHDSVVYEIPEQKLHDFVKAAHPIVQRRPTWSSIALKSGVEVGRRFGDLVDYIPPTATTSK
ncbi:DNA polymerase, partial [Symmachiella dynata]|uniref:DNA polymerase n=1 Tax=Symmachiella dynata TaxID=2527995 RepID=UPI0030EC4439